jgi:hypothetical protein
MRFAVTWDGHSVGDEEIVVEAAAPGGRQIRAAAAMASFGFEGGAYRSAVTVDDAGADQSAWFEFDGDDGLNRVEMTRVDGAVRVRHREATADDVEFTVDDPEGTTLFGRAMTPLYARLAERLADLAVGEETDVPAIAPGLPPDLSVAQATLHAVRLPTESGDFGARYLVEFRRPNWTASALLRCDRENRPVDVAVGSDMAYWLNNTATSPADDASVVRASRVP